MGLLKDFMEAVEKGDAFVKKVMENPLVDHGIDWAGDYLMLHPFRKNAQTGKREVDRKWLRTEASALFASTALDENLLRQITYSPHLLKGHRVALFDNWGPDPTINLMTTTPVASLGEVGPNQWADIRLSLVEELFKPDRADPNVAIPLEGAEKEAKIKELGIFLTELAKLSNAARLGRFVKLHYCRPQETDYSIVKFQRLRHRVFTTVGELLEEFANWLADPGPTGFRNIATMAAAGVDVFSDTVSESIDEGTMWLHQRAERRSRGIIGRLARLMR